MANVTFESDILIQGYMGAEDNSTAETTTDATPRKIAAFDTDGSSPKNCVVDSTTDNDITISKAGYVFINCSVSFSGTASKTFVVEIYINGSPVTENAKLERKLGAAGDVGSASVSWAGPVSASDVVTIYHSSTDGGSAFTAQQLQLSVLGFASSGA